MDSQSYFLGGSNIGWMAIGASLFASNISTEHFIGLAGTGASSGLAVGQFEWLACLILLLLGWLFVPFYRRTGVFTMPEFLERRYNPACRTYLSAVSLIAYVFTKVSVSILRRCHRARNRAGLERMDLRHRPSRRPRDVDRSDRRRLLQYMEIDGPPRLPLDGHPFRGSHSGHLVWVYRSDDRATDLGC